MTAVSLKQDSGEHPVMEADASPEMKAGAQPLINPDAPALAEARGAPLDLKVYLIVPGADYKFEGVIEHFFGGEASILVDYRFQKDTRVKVEFHGFQFDGDVLFCERKGDLFDTHVVLADHDETGVRRDSRYVVNLPGRIHVPGTDRAADAKLVDISRDGIGVESALPLNIGDTVAIESQLNLAFGIVRHCRQLPTGSYRAGLQVHGLISKEEVPLERQQYRPEQKKQPWMRLIRPRLSSGQKRA